MSEKLRILAEPAGIEKLLDDQDPNEDPDEDPDEELSAELKRRLVEAYFQAVTGTAD